MVEDSILGQYNERNMGNGFTPWNKWWDESYLVSVKRILSYRIEAERKVINDQR